MIFLLSNSCQISIEYEGTNIKNIKGDKCPKIKLEAPIKIGQIVAKNLFGKKIDLVATRKIDIKN
ncbi:hypothetical protein CVT91_03745 [Candidatus Atribacteria bacterium HGW-Atribacteria-1]|nr:MAG: hypothetical protein CVT91_03745 [Candidatus Atribacteria bacterium HGW-Atribacteria-1]